MGVRPRKAWRIAADSLSLKMVSALVDTIAIRNVSYAMIVAF